jgi:CRISPR-associated protein Cmr4
MGIAREVHTEFPYLPSSSLRGRIRAAIEQTCSGEAGWLFGQKISEGSQPTEGEVWFADATLLFFPVASLNHHIVWITCPLWLERWSRWLTTGSLTNVLAFCNEQLATKPDDQKDLEKTAIVSIPSCDRLYLQTALLNRSDIVQLQHKTELEAPLGDLLSQPFVGKLLEKLVILREEDCLALLETGLQREVRVALEDDSKTVKGGSFRSEEAIPPETILFFPWGLKPENSDAEKSTTTARSQLVELTRDRQQFGGLEGLGRGWTQLITPAPKSISGNEGGTSK